jgi:predicted N-acetyltransferase YhbS
MTITIRTLTRGDVAVADDILVAAFAAARSYAHDLNRNLAIQPDGWFMALRDGTPVGTAGSIDYGAFAYVGLVSVRPEAQRQGIGLALMEHVLAWLERRNCPLVVLDASVAGMPMYVRLGFVETDRTLVLRSNAKAFPRLASGHAHPMRFSELPEVGEFDASIFGARRAAVLRAYLTDFPDRAYATRDGAGRLTGYVIAQDHTIGPWLAQTVDDARALLAAVQSLDYHDGPRVIVPMRNTDAVSLLTGCGFAESRSQCHMQRGVGVAPGNRAQLYGQISMALG